MLCFVFLNWLLCYFKTVNIGSQLSVVMDANSVVVFLQFD